MLTLSQALKSKTNWAALFLVALPEIWNMVSSDPTIHIPDTWKHYVTLAGAVFVVIFRTMNTQGNPPQPQ
jgi:hypothetical protein